MKEILEKLKKYIKKLKRELSKDKNKYYWKRKYYRLLRDVNNERKRNDQLAIDLRKMYSEVKKYQRLIKEKEGNNENSRVGSIWRRRFN